MIRRLLCCAILGIFSLAIVACDDGENYAPVTEVNTIEPIPASGMHRVMHGETLYEVAWRYGLDYRYLALRNHLHFPYATHPGQAIYLQGAGASSKKPALVITEKETKAPIFDSDSKWLWPAKGKILHNFSNGNKGIDIGGKWGEPIYAAAAGKVVYSGHGIRGYGNLIILKHNSIYLSAYANNRILFVKEGDGVMRGQKIAEMGGMGANKVMLHFEIRRAGKPINPAAVFR